MLTMASCGSDEPASTERNPGSERSAPAKASASGAQCKDHLGGLLRSLNTLRRRLAFGLSYERYVYDVRKVKAAYDEVPVDTLAIDCVVSAATPSERALNRYIAAANTWGDCLATAGCNSTSVEPKLQREWRRASNLLSEADLSSLG